MGELRTEKKCHMTPSSWGANTSLTISSAVASSAQSRQGHQGRTICSEPWQQG